MNTAKAGEPKLSGFLPLPKPNRDSEAANIAIRV